VTSDPGGLVAATLATLSQMPALERAMSAGAFIAAVQGPDDRRIAKVRWSAIAELADSGMGIKEIAEALDITVEAVDLALQANGRSS
jgi:DNA-binding NarL/FixJ family response regulator